MQFGRHQGGFIVPFPTGILVDLNVAGQYEIIPKASLDPVLSILTLRRSSEVSLPPSRGAKRQRSGSEALVFIPGCDVAWFLRLPYASMKSSRADWRAANGELADVPTEAEAPSVDMMGMEDLVLLLENDACWTQDVGSVDPHLVEMWRQCQDELSALSLSDS